MVERRKRALWLGVRIVESGTWLCLEKTENGGKRFGVNAEYDEDWSWAICRRLLLRARIAVSSLTPARSRPRAGLRREASMGKVEVV